MIRTKTSHLMAINLEKAGKWREQTMHFERNVISLESSNAQGNITKYEIKKYDILNYYTFA